MAMFIVKPWYRKKDAIYGAEWAGTSDPSWTRTDAAVGFSAPNPYYSGMSGSPSSPFDNIMPWSGMRRVTDANAGELVEIPKFYYKWTRDGVKMKLQISMSQFDGSHVSPAHADRGDGVGERPYVYVGRYLCASDYKSKTANTPQTDVTRAGFRTAIHNLGSYVYQYDFAMWWTIRMLYLVEYADWNCQTKISRGANEGNSTGVTDTMPYHTGTIENSRSIQTAGVQYRNIEALWSMKGHFIDGIYFPSNGSSVYVINNPSLFSDTSNGQFVGSRPQTLGVGVVTGWSTPVTVGLEWALFPSSRTSFSSSSYTTDVYYYDNTGAEIVNYELTEGSWNYGSGMFELITANGVSSKTTAWGSRLMVLPSTRLAA